jgi:hypothetical protein
MTETIWTRLIGRFHRPKPATVIAAPLVVIAPPPLKKPAPIETEGYRPKRSVTGKRIPPRGGSSAKRRKK